MNEILKDQLKRIEEKLDGLIASVEYPGAPLKKILESEVKSPSNAPSCPSEDEICYRGFKLCYRWSLYRDGSKRYYWYAGRTIEGKRREIYVGIDRGKFASKVDAWLEKNPGFYAKLQREEGAK